MKKVLLLMLCVLMVVAGCGNKEITMDDYASRVVEVLEKYFHKEIDRSQTSTNIRHIMEDGYEEAYEDLANKAIKEDDYTTLDKIEALYLNINKLPSAVNDEERNHEVTTIYWTIKRLIEAD